MLFATHLATLSSPSLQNSLILWFPVGAQGKYLHLRTLIVKNMH